MLDKNSIISTTTLNCNSQDYMIKNSHNYMTQ
jgi:hypothetical protein